MDIKEDSKIELECKSALKFFNALDRKLKALRRFKIVNQRTLLLKMIITQVDER